MCLFYAYFLAYLPMGLRLLLQINWSEGPWTMFSPSPKTKGFLPNVNNRQAVQNLVATSPLAARLNGAHLNQMEGYTFFAAGVLACMQAGVDAAVVEDCCIFFLACRAAFVAFYIIGVNNLIGNFRTGAWFGIVVIQAKLFFLAAAAASE
jgi:uncharacterized MAPEG superfamily protein|eukprot:COSAG06_NODE_1483_length_9302_cov_14.188525_3_plen_150_part_00